ncbi:hypothetical protein [Thomasclavelia cocleata]|uniref:hypothetical protein n=1 Tax=Thomasclavelia cocleata TaxID=69824 RepID=UPI0025705EBF|nr:hypothetical protein [Thomasclavelia cocleata]
MAIVLKGNKQLTIEEHKIEDYVAQGYDYIDNCGNILTKGDPITLTDYKRENAVLKKEIKTKDRLLQEATDKIKTLENSIANKETEIEALNAEIIEFKKNQSASKNAKSASK